MDDDLDLISLRETLQKKHGLAAPTYSRLWRAAVNGHIPARRVRRVWHVRKDDIPLAEAYYELTAPATPHAA
jgi:hypothetical protein